MSALNFEGWKRDIYLTSGSDNSTRSADVGGDAFLAFLRETTGAKTDEEVFTEIVSLREGKSDVYRLLLDFAIWLNSKGLKPATVRNYIYSAKSFLVFHEAKITLEDFKPKVSKKMPKVRKMEDAPLTTEIVRLRSLGLHIWTSIEPEVLRFLFRRKHDPARVGDAPHLLCGIS